MPLPSPRSPGPPRQLLPAARAAFYARLLTVSGLSSRAGVGVGDTRTALRGGRVRASAAAALEAVLLPSPHA